MKKIARLLLVAVALLLVAGAGAGCTAKAKKAYHHSRADKYYAAGDLAKAEVEYLNVLRFDQADPPANSRLGQIYYDQGRLQRALYFLGKGSQLSPDNLDVRLKLGYIYSSVGEYTQAVAQANFVLAKNPRDNDAAILLVEGSPRPQEAEAVRARLQTLARTADGAGIEVALGNLALRQRDLAAANAAFKKAQALDPKLPAVNAGLAAAAWAQGDLKQAGACFSAAADASPIRSPRRMQSARFKVETGDLAGARTALDKLLKAAPDYLPAMMMLAEISAGEKKFAEAADWLDKVLKLDPDNFDGLFFQGQLEMARSQPEKAVAEMDRMARVYPRVAQVHYQLAVACLAIGDPVKAGDSLRRALELNPNYAEAILLLARIQIQSNNPGPATAALERLRQRDPAAVQPQLLLADAYRQQDRLAAALEIYRALETANPTNSQVWLLHGATLLQAKDNAGARQAFDRVLELAPGQTTAIEQLVDLDLTERKFDDATRFINRQIQLSPQQAALRITAGKIFLVQKRNDEAEAALTDALKVDPGSLGAELLLAQIYLNEGKRDQALAKARSITSRDTQNTSALMLAAQVYELEKDYPNAAATYEKLLKANPKFSDALNNLAYLYSEYLNQLDRAYELAQRARELQPFDPSTADTLGWICYKKGLYPAALGFLKESVAKAAANPEIQYHFGLASYMTDNEDAARAALEAAQKSGANFPGQADCVRYLAILAISPTAADAPAQAALEQAVSEKPNDPVALIRLAHIYQRAGNTAKAEAAYEAILRPLPQNLDALLNLARLYATHDLKKAYDTAKLASQAAPYDAEVAHTLGRLAFLNADFHLAASTLQQAADKQPNDAVLLFDYAQAAYSLGRVADAQTALQGALAASLPAETSAQARRMLEMMALAAAPAQAAASPRLAEILKTEPADVPALMALAAASEYGAQTAAAEQAAEKALAHYPDFTPAQQQLARLYAADPAKLDRAGELASKAHDALPDDAETSKILGEILVRRGDYIHAANLLKQSALKIQNDPELFFYLGKAQFQLKNRGESKSNLQQALTLKLSGPLAVQAQQMLNDLK